MTKFQKERIKQDLNFIRKSIDRYDEKMDKAEANGDMERYAELDKAKDMRLRELDGMTTVLKIMGYAVIQGKSEEPWYICEV